MANYGKKTVDPDLWLAKQSKLSLVIFCFSWDSPWLFRGIVSGSLCAALASTVTRSGLNDQLCPLAEIHHLG